jgi:hypothetical protein
MPTTPMSMSPEAVAEAAALSALSKAALDRAGGLVSGHADANINSFAMLAHDTIARDGIGLDTPNVMRALIAITPAGDDWATE